MPLPSPSQQDIPPSRMFCPALHDSKNEHISRDIIQILLIEAFHDNKNEHIPQSPPRFHLRIHPDSTPEPTQNPPQNPPRIHPRTHPESTPEPTQNPPRHGTRDSSCKCSPCRTPPLRQRNSRPHFHHHQTPPECGLHAKATTPELLRHRSQRGPSRE